MKTPISYYDILGVNPRASEDDIKRAYHKLAKRFHPDNNPRSKRLAALKLKAINQAYGTLKNKEKRATYNRLQNISAMNGENDNNKSLSILSRMTRLFSQNIEDTNRG